MRDINLKTSMASVCFMVFLLLPFSSMAEENPANTPASNNEKNQKPTSEIFSLGQITEFILAAGALGAAAMAIAEGCKLLLFPPIGFKRLREELTWADEALKVAYGENFEDLQKSHYRMGRGKGALPKTLRQGIRIGMNEDTVETMAVVVGGLEKSDLSDVARKVKAGSVLDDKDKNILGRFEVAADARIDAALALAERSYINRMHLRAFIIAIVLSLLSALFLSYHYNWDHLWKYLGFGLMTGLIAVPIAPIAKDLTKALQSAAKSVRTVK